MQRIIIGMISKQSKHWDAKWYTEKGRYYNFAFIGSTVLSIRVGGDFRLQLNDEFMTVIELAMPFNCTQSGQTEKFDSDNGAESFAPLLSLVGKVLLKASASKIGFLKLEFDDGTVIKAPSDSSEHRYEAWQISDYCGFLVVCSLGGNVAIWLPNEQT